MKKMLVLLMAIMMMATFVNVCATAEEAVTLRFAWWGSASRAEVYNAICDEFEALYPQYKIEREFSSGLASYFEKFATQVAGGNAPDIISMHPRFQADYASRGVMADLAPYIEQGVIQTQNINKSVLESGMVNGVLYGLPQGVTVSEWFVNKTLCDKYGVTIPDENTFWTWDEFVDACHTFRKNALAAGDNVYFAEESCEYNYFRLYARSRGYEIFTEDGKLGHDAQLLADWWTMWKQMQEADVIPSAEATNEDKGATLEEKLFTQGKVATLEKAINQYDQYAAANKDEILIMHTPAGDSGNGVYIEGCHIGVSAQTSAEKAKAAAIFVDFFVNNEKAVSHMLLQQGIPANSEMSGMVYNLSSNDQKTIIWWIEHWINDLGLANGVNPPDNYSAIANLYEEYRQYVSFGSMSAMEAAEGFCADAQDILK